MTLRALSYDRFGAAEVLHFSELPDPVPGEGEVVVAIDVRSINLIDIRVRKGMLGPLVNKRFPKVPGADFAGTVVAVGVKVADLQVGARVFGAADPFRGGAFASRIAVPARQVAPLPDALAAEDAAALPIAGLAALQALRDLGRIRPGQQVLIHGATGPVGLFAVQLARLAGAQVTAVAGAGLDLAGELGATRLIDYRTQTLHDDMRFDVILNASGRMPFAAGRALLTPAGRLIEPSPTIPVFIGSKLANLFRRQKHMVLATAVRRADLAELARLAGEGAIRVVIAARFGFADSVAAMNQVERGGTVGKVIVA